MKTHAKQVKTFGPVFYSEGGRKYRIYAKVRFDDSCGNGYNTLGITADIDEQRGGHWCEYAGGCCHDEIAKHFPELRGILKFHLCGWNGPMHYVANTVYHASQHGATHAWVYYTGPNDPAGLGGTGERLLTYATAAKAKTAEGKDGYRVVWDEKTIKVRNLDHARSTAAWPDATDAELTEPGLDERLAERLPALLVELRAAIESVGLEWERAEQQAAKVA